MFIFFGKFCPPVCTFLDCMSISSVTFWFLYVYSITARLVELKSVCLFFWQIFSPYMHFLDCMSVSSVTFWFLSVYSITAPLVELRHVCLFFLANFVPLYALFQTLCLSFICTVSQFKTLEFIFCLDKYSEKKVFGRLPCVNMSNNQKPAFFFKAACKFLVHKKSCQG